MHPYIKRQVARDSSRVTYVKSFEVRQASQMEKGRRYKLTVEYDGSDFVGWQFQTNGLSVQAVIECAASELLQEEIRVIGAGRTDAGVHARGMTAHFDSKADLDINTIHRGLNALLPDDVTIHQVEEVSHDFHARFFASSRTYAYYLVHRRTSLDRYYCSMVYYPLNDEEIHRAVELIQGTHDFTSFSKFSDDVEHCRCHVFEAEWKTSGLRSVFTIRANRFLYGMVRMIVSALIDVGRGKISAAAFKEILERKDRSSVFGLAPAQGLVLESVQYDQEEFELVKRLIGDVQADDELESE